MNSSTISRMRPLHCGEPRAFYDADELDEMRIGEQQELRQQVRIEHQLCMRGLHELGSGE